MKRLGSLWNRVGKEKGTQYFSGFYENTRIVVFENGKKKGERDPDWIIYEQEQKS
jgi:DNA relaxase NicK